MADYASDVIGGFPYASPLCKGCGKPLLLENAWMTDGCPCNTPLGINNTNETRWRLLMQLQQKQSYELEALRAKEKINAEFDSEDGQEMQELIEDVKEEIIRQGHIYPQGFMASRDGVRLGLASVQDELDETLKEWHAEKNELEWKNLPIKLLQTICVGIRLLRAIRNSTE